MRVRKAFPENPPTLVQGVSVQADDTIMLTLAGRQAAGVPITKEGLNKCP